MKKRVVLVGYGGMGSFFHAPHILGSDVVELAGIVDIREERRALAREKNIFVYDSLEAALADPTVEIVTIATPNDFHEPIAIQALAAGKNVISEKPVTVSSKLLQNMIDAANAAGKLFTVHQNRRFDGDYLSMKNIFESGIIGDVFNIESYVHGSRGIPTDWRSKKEPGGGMVLDWGVHLLDQMLQMVPFKLKYIYAHLDHVTTDEVDDGCRIDLTFENNVIAHIEVGTSNFITHPRWYMQGVNGTAVSEWDIKQGKIIYCHDKAHGDDVKPVVTAAGVTKTMAPRDSSTIEELPIPFVPSDVHDFYRNFCAAIDGKATQLVTHPQMKRVMGVMEAAFESDRTHKVIAFE